MTETKETHTECIVAPILVVDDNTKTASLLAKVLDAAGYHTHVALRGSEALEFVREHPCAAALVDIHLPDLNGLVLTQKLRDLCGPRLPIIVLSGDTSMEVINALSYVGATYFFSKPVNVPHLLECLAEWAVNGKQLSH